MGRQELIQEVVDLQRKVDRTRRQYELDAWIGLNITAAQLKSMFFISHEGTTNLSKLAEALEVTPTNVTGIADRLVKKGLVDRSPSEQDRRVLLLRLTREGENLVGSLREKRRGYMREVLNRLSDEELAVLAKGFASLSRAVQASEKEARK